MYVLYKLIITVIVIEYVGSEECRSLPSDGEDGVSLDPSSVYRQLSPSGYGQCIRECGRYTECGSVSYDRDTLTCTLLRKTERPLQTKTMASIGACSGGVCNAGTVCLTLTQGGYSCVVTDRWCPTYINGRCYTLSDNVAKWSFAKIACERNGYSLATVDSADLLLTLSNGLPTGIRVFVGGTNIANETQWFWTDGNIPIDFTGIPHYLQYDLEHKDCLAIEVSDSIKLVDSNCAHEFLYLCQSPLIKGLATVESARGATPPSAKRHPTSTQSTTKTH